VLVDGRDRATGKDLRSGADHARQQLFVIAGRPDGGVLPVDDAAMVDVSADFRALLRAGHGMRLDLEPLRLMGNGPRQSLVLPCAMGGMKPSDHREIAVHSFRT